MLQYRRVPLLAIPVCAWALFYAHCGDTRVADPFAAVTVRSRLGLVSDESHVEPFERVELIETAPELIDVQEDVTPREPTSNVSSVVPDETAREIARLDQVCDGLMAGDWIPPRVTYVFALTLRRFQEERRLLLTQATELRSSDSRWEAIADARARLWGARIRALEDMGLGEYTDTIVRTMVGSQATRDAFRECIAPKQGIR